MNPRILFLINQLFPFLLIVCLIPRLGRTRRGLLFGVTVPLDFADTPVAKASLRRYQIWAFGVAIVAALVWPATSVLQRHFSIPQEVSTTLLLVFEMIALTALWQRERRAIRPYAIAVPLERSAGLTPSDHAGALPAAASALLPVAVVGLWLRAHWSLIPERWPQHWNAAGQVNGWGVRTTGGVYLPLLMGAFVVASFVAMVGFMAYASGSQSRQRERILAPLAALAWTISLFFCTIGLLPLLHLMTGGSIAVLLVLHMVLILGIVVWMVLRSGFMAGSTAAQTSEPYDGTADRFWYGGIFYYNPGDAAVLVPKRYGWGWTFNFARPAAWMFTAAIVGFAVLSIWLPRLLR